MKNTATKIKKQIRDIAIIIGITFVLLFLLELFLRIVFSDKVESFNFQVTEPAYIFDPNYLIKLKPNTEKTYFRQGDNEENNITWKVNSNGFRGKELRDDADIRIIVYGDSNIQARFTRYENLFTSQLEKQLTKLVNKNVEVVNAGIIGAGPDQNLIRFQIDADLYSPDIVIFHIFADNDFGDIVRNRLFYIDPEGDLKKTGGERQEDPHIRKSKLSIVLSEIWRKTMIFKLCRGLRKSIAGEEGEKIGKTIIEQGLAQREREFDIYLKNREKEISVFADSYDYDLALFPDKEAGKVKKELMKGVLTAAEAYAKQKKIKFLVLIQPSSFDLCESAFPNFQDGKVYKGYQKGNLSFVLDDICLKNNIQKVNLYDIFLQNNPESLFIKGDDHWNDSGQKLAADIVTKYLCKNFLLDEK